jgi:hypothetical protein
MRKVAVIGKWLNDCLEAKFIIYVFSSEEFYVGNFFPQNKICFAKMIDESITSQKVHNFINNEMNMLI